MTIEVITAYLKLCAHLQPGGIKPHKFRSFLSLDVYAQQVNVDQSTGLFISTQYYYRASYYNFYSNEDGAKTCDINFSSLNSLLSSNYAPMTDYNNISSSVTFRVSH